MPCNLSCCIVSTKSTYTHAHPFENNKKINDKFKGWFDRKCQNFCYCVEVKLYKNRLFFCCSMHITISYFGFGFCSVWFDFMSRTVLFPICIFLRFVSFRYFHFGYDIFFRIFCALNNHQKQQHPITCITNHVPFGAWYWIKWLLNSYKHSTCYMCYMVHGHIDTDAFKYTYTQALSKLACVPDERNHGN